MRVTPDMYIFLECRRSPFSRKPMFIKNIHTALSNRAKRPQILKILGEFQEIAEGSVRNQCICMHLAGRCLDDRADGCGTSHHSHMVRNYCGNIFWHSRVVLRLTLRKRSPDGSIITKFEIFLLFPMVYI